MARKQISEDKLKELAAQLGFTVKKVREYERKTFVIEKEALEEFLNARQKSGMKLQDAVTEALRDWSQKRKKD